VRLVSQLDALFQLVQQMVGQAEGIALLGFEHAYRTLLDGHHLHRDIVFLQVLYPGSVVVTGMLKQHNNLLEWHVGAHPINEAAKTLPCVLHNERWTGFKALMPFQKSSRNKASNVPGLSNIDAHVK